MIGFVFSEAYWLTVGGIVGVMGLLTGYLFAKMSNDIPRNNLGVLFIEKYSS